MHAVEIKNLNKFYKKQHAVKNLSLTIKKGDFFALLGPNGAGKSTTIGILSSLVNKTEGTIKVFNKDLLRDSAFVKESIGLVPQEFNFNIFERVQDILVQQAGYYGMPEAVAKERAMELLTILSLEDKARAKARTLSGGMKRKLMIARALMHSPKLLILDEPTAGVDVETRRQMWEFLRELHKKGTTILLTTHYLEEAEQLCKHVGIINEGEIILQGTMKSVLSKLQKESFIVDVKKAKKVKVLKGAEFEVIDDKTIQIVRDRSIAVSDIFSHLTKQGIIVDDIRNKTNRLEELFIELTHAK